MWGKTEGLGAKENRFFRTFKRKESKIPMTMTTESKEFVIYLFATYSFRLPVSLYLITTLQLDLSN